jgi:ATP-dependent Clp protease ATP-binding subunit ClpC
VLRAARDRYETYHSLSIRDDALEAAVQLSAPWTTRHFPGKAVQLLDQACALARWKALGTPPDLFELDSQIEQLNTQKEALLAEHDFEKAATFRDQADKIKKRKKEIIRRWREGMAVMVDAAVVTAAATRPGSRPAGPNPTPHPTDRPSVR